MQQLQLPARMGRFVKPGLVVGRSVRAPIDNAHDDDDETRGALIAVFEIAAALQ